MKMKQALLLLVLAFGVCQVAKAQVKIGENPQNIHRASVLELESTDKVLVITRVSTAQMTSISPREGALVYNTDEQSVHYYDGVQWVNIGNGIISLAPESVGTSQIINGSITGADIGALSLRGDDLIVPGSITEAQLGENSVGPKQLQNAVIDLGDFNNVAGYIKGVDILSKDQDNALAFGADGGVFFDDSLLMDDIANNAADIADIGIPKLNEVLDEDNDGGGLLIKNILDPVEDQDAATKAYVDQSAATGSDNQNIGPVTFDATTNELSIEIEDGNSGLVSLADLIADGSETKINGSATVLVTGMGTVAEPYKFTAVGVGGSGTTEVADLITITGTGTSANPFKIKPGGNGQFLKTDTAGNIAWETVIPGSSGTTEVVDGTLLTGEGTTAEPFTIAPGDANQILRTNTAGDGLNWVDLPPVVSDDNQTAEEVPFTPTDNTESSNVQAAIVELQSEIDTFSTTSGQSNIATNLGVGGVGLVLTKDEVELPFKSINSGVSSIITVADDATNNEIDLDIANKTITAIKLNDMGADDGQVLKWDEDTALWKTAADDTGITTLDDGNIYVGNTADAPAGVPMSGDATIINTGVLTIKEDAITLAKIAQNGATTDGDIMKWNNTTEAWEVGVNEGHLGNNINNIFFAGPDGVPHDTESNDDPTKAETTKDNGGIFWDSSKRFNTGALYLGLKLNGATELLNSGFSAIGDHSKLVVAERYDNLNANAPGALAFPIQMVNESIVNGAGTGLLFAINTDGNPGKGALVFQRGASESEGDFHFLISKSPLNTRPKFNESVLTIENDGDLKLFGGIDINGTVDGTGFGTAGQVLSSTGTGLLWVDNVDLPTATEDGQIIVWDEDNLGPSTGAWVTGTSDNLATNNLAQDDESRTYDLKGRTLNFNSSVTGGNIGIGNFDNDSGTTIPALSTDKLDVNGQIRARKGFAASPGTANLPSYGFYTDDDDDIAGMYRQGPNQIAFSAGGEKVLSIENDGTNLDVKVEGRLEINSTLLDTADNVGTTGQVLSSTNIGVAWVNPAGGLIAKGRSSVAGTVNGEYVVPIPDQDGADYLINATPIPSISPQALVAVVSDQQDTNFTVTIFEITAAGATPVVNADFFYTVYSLP